jgi:hypothetical protein
MKISHDGVLYDPDDLDAPTHESVEKWSFRFTRVRTETVIELITLRGDSRTLYGEVLVW